MTALQAAVDRLESYCLHPQLQQVPKPRPLDPDVLHRLVREVEVCARSEAVQQWLSGKPF